MEAKEMTTNENAPEVTPDYPSDVGGVTSGVTGYGSD